MIEFSVKNTIIPFKAKLRLAFVFAACGLFAGCGSKEEFPVLSSTLRNQPVEVRMRSEEKRSLEAVLFDFKQEVDRLIPLFDPFSDRSEISTINQTAGISRVPISFDTFRLLEHILRFSELSEGAFDVTTSPVSELWGFEGGLAPSQPLSRGILQAALRGVGVDRILLTENSIRLTSPFTKLDVYDLVTPFGLDLVIINERKNEVTDLMIQYEHSLRTLGRPSSKEPWSYPITHPLTQEILGEAVLDEFPAMAWSPLSNEKVVIAGQTYRNQIDPRTGMPNESILLAVAVCKSATKAHALSKALMFLEKEDIMPMVERFQESAALVVPNKDPLEIWVIEAGNPVFKISEPYLPAVEMLSR